MTIIKDIENITKNQLLYEIEEIINTNPRAHITVGKWHNEKDAYDLYVSVDEPNTWYHWPRYYLKEDK